MSEPAKTDFSPDIRKQLAGLESFSKTYTESTLSRGKTRENAAKLIRKIDMIAEEFIEAVHRDNESMSQAGRARRIACAKGCAHCCHQAVGATIPEVLRVADFTRVNFTESQRVALDRRIESYAKAKSALKPGQKIVHTCPLLIDDVCSVFEARPLRCRGFNSVDVNACIQFRDEPGEVTLPCSLIQVSAAEALTVGLRDGLANSGVSNDFVEFAPALSIALASEDATERYFAGEGLFDSTKQVVPVAP